MRVQVRPYQPSDHDAIVGLWRTVFPDAPPRNDPVRDLARKLAVQPELFLVALVEDRVAGTTLGGFDGHRGWVHLVAVEPRLRRRGIGSALMREAESRLAAMGCPKLNLQVRGDNAGVVPFYESLGYRVEDRISLGKLLEARE